MIRFYVGFYVFILILGFPPYPFSLFGVNLWFKKKKIQKSLIVLLLFLKAALNDTGIPRGSCCSSVGALGNQ